MTSSPITEDDLHAFVDNALEPERRAEVATYLESHPDVAKRIADDSDQRSLLRTALAPIAQEPVPTSLNLSRIIESRRRPRMPGRWATAAMLLVSLGVGGLGGWVTRGSLPGPSAGLVALAQEATDSYRVYAPDHIRPVELRAADSDQLVRWISSRLHQQVKVPDLSASGYRLMGGRLVATSHGPAAMFMYDDDHGSRVVVLTRSMSSADQNAPMTAQSKGDVSGFSWADDGFGYSVVGPGSPDVLRPVANEVRRQARAA